MKQAWIPNEETKSCIVHGIIEQITEIMLVIVVIYGIGYGMVNYGDMLNNGFESRYASEVVSWIPLSIAVVELLIMYKYNI